MRKAETSAVYSAARRHGLNFTRMALMVEVGPVPVRKTPRRLRAELQARGVNYMAEAARIAQLEEWANNVRQTNHPYNFRVRIGETEGMKDPFVQVQCFRPDIFTGEFGWGGSGKAYVSQYCTESEFYQMCLGMGLAYIEHEFREGFHVKGERPFHPHISTDALIEASHITDARKTPTVAASS